jgi:DNA-binding transcriptional MocR family regulator
MNWLDILGPETRHKDRRKPIYGRITERIKECIQSGKLAENERLPADRELAKLLQVDRSTIARAYDELQAAGFVSSQVGRGTFVLARATEPQVPKRSAGSGFDRLIWSDKFSRASQTASSIMTRQPVSTVSGGNTISLGGGVPTEEFFPQQEFQEIVADLLASNQSAEMFGYSLPEGHPRLRQEVRKLLSAQGIEAADDELLILSGSQQGIDLVSRTLLDPGDVVLMEDPTYFWAICNFSSAGARCIPATTYGAGLNIDVLDNVMERQRPKLLYVMPSFQNPTGSTMSVDERTSLLDLARYHQVAILEDNFVGDLSYDATPPRSLRSMDRSGGTVIYQGTFSKALCPGLRLGWLVAPREVMARLQLTKRTCDLSTNSMAQVIVAEYLQRGLYEKHLRHVRSIYRSRRDALCDALAKQLPSWRWTKPEGGMFVWAQLPAEFSARELLRYAEQQGVTFSPGDTFFIGTQRTDFLRLTFIQSKEEEIIEGVTRLAKAFQIYQSMLRPKGADDTPNQRRVSESTFI